MPQIQLHILQYTHAYTHTYNHTGINRQHQTNTNTHVHTLGQRAVNCFALKLKCLRLLCPIIGKPPQREIVTLRGGAEGGSEFGHAEQLVKRLTDSLTALSVRGRLNLHSWTWLVSFSYPVRVAAAREGYNVYIVGASGMAS